MATLKQFARRIRQRGRDVETGADAVVRATAIAINQAVVSATPVDTGRARANWIVGLGAPVRQDTEATDPGGGDTISSNNNKIGQRRGDSDVYLSNNLDYINDLNQGTSAQAPAGFVEQAVMAGVRAVERIKLLRRR